MFLSTLSNIVLESIENSNVNVIKDIQYDNITNMGHGHINKIAELLHNIEEECKHMPSSEKNKVDYLDMSSKLLDLANIEDDNNNNNILAAFYKFISEQILMINTTFNKRMHPADSFAIACGLHLDNNSTYAYEMLRKKCPFILLPDKRTLFDVNQKAAIPHKCFSMIVNVHHIASYLKKLPTQCQK